MPPRPRRAAAAPALIDRLSDDVVFAWLPAPIAEAAVDLVKAGRVARPAIGTTRIEAIVADRGRRVRATIAWGATGPASRCDCGKRSPCAHAAAIAILLLGGAVGGDVNDEADGQTDEARTDGAPIAEAAELERRRRVERGASELFEVRPHPSTRVYGAWDVGSPSARTYDVVIRALDEPHNGCTCPDFATNLLGTCKHVEAVLHHLRKNAPRKLREAAAAGPPSSYLHLAFPDGEASREGEVRLRLAPNAARRLPARRLAADRLAGDLASAWPALRDQLVEAGVEIPREVERHVERLRERAERERRAAAVLAEVRAAGRDQPGFRAALYPYQVEGVAFLAARGRALLADEMGLGKTAQAIAAMARLMRTDGVRRTVVVCPTSLKHQWQREIARFTTLGERDVAVVAGTRAERVACYRSEAAVLITGYELARTDERDLEALGIDLLILDEAQRIKNWRTRTADVVKRLRTRFAFVLTGTPLENRLDDLYSLMQVIDPHLFGPLWRFNEDFTTLDERGRVTGYRNLDRLRARVAGVLLRRRKEEVLTELPERIVTRLEVPLTDQQRAIHDEAEGVVGRLLAILKRRPLTPVEEKRLMSAFQRMRMACDAAELCDDDAPKGAPKLDELSGLLEEICVAGGRKVVVFSEWEKMQALAAAVCERAGIGHVRLHGGVPSAKRGALIDRFREDPSCRVFLSTDAGGVGLNLQVASHVINLDLPWNPAVLAQRIARVHRLGQREAVNVVLLVSRGSFEERMEVTLEAKRALFAAAVGDDATTTELERSSFASRIATLLGGAFAAATGKEAVAAAPDPVAALREKLGPALERVVRLSDGRLLGVVRGEGVPAAAEPNAVLLPSRAAEALGALGPASPLAAGELLWQADPVAPADAQRALRRERLATAERKLGAARALVAASLGSEALGPLRDALALACRALDERGDPGDDPAALLGAVYGHLVPSGALTPADAHALVRAGELARAFDGSPLQPPESLIAEVMEEARSLVARARERLGA